MKTVKISFIFFILIVCMPDIYAQVLIRHDSILFSGVVINKVNSETLPNVTCRYGRNKGTLSDADGCFRLATHKGDTILFTYVGFKACEVVIPDTLSEPEYMVGVFMSPDTVQLSEALIVRRWGAHRQQMLINARNNMLGIMRQAYAPVKNMDASMNQQMMINEYARSVEMKGHVDVRAGVGTQSIDAYKRLRMLKRVREKEEWLNPGEIDLLKKIFYLEKRENLDN